MSQFDIHGFDLEAQTIIAKRHTILQKFLRPRWGSESLMLDSISEKEEAVRAEAETISKSFADIPMC